MSRWGKPKKNKRFIDPRYYLEEKNEELLEEGFGRWLQDKVMAPVFLDDEELGRYNADVRTAEASDIARSQNRRGVTDEDLELASAREPYSFGDAYWDTAIGLGSPTAWAVEQAKPWADEAMEAVAPAMSRYFANLPTDAISPTWRIFGQSLPLITDAPLVYYGITDPDQPADSWISNLDPRARSFADPTTPQGARDYGGTGLGTIGGLYGGYFGGAPGAAAGSAIGELLGRGGGQGSYMYGQLASDWWNRRPESWGGMTDEQLQNAYWDYQQSQDASGPYDPTQRRSARRRGQTLQQEATMKKNHLLTESEIKRFKALSNIKENKHMLSESVLGAVGFLAAIFGGGLAASHALAKAQERGHLRGIDPGKYTGSGRAMDKAVDRIHQRAKEQDPLMLSFVREIMTQAKRDPSMNQRLALAKEFANDPNVAEIVETLSYSSNKQEVYSALQDLQTYLESKSSEQNGEQI